jgi:uncharacterized protein YndB with AHSA1/START domain
MSKKFKAQASVVINASREKVWEALTTPEQIKKYLFGTTAVSDWKVGSPLIFKGEWEGKTYEDKGIILASEKPKLFRYTYWSSMSGMEDRPENYMEITYELKDVPGGTELVLTQSNAPDEKSRDHSEQNWKVVLDGLKKVAEA